MSIVRQLYHLGVIEAFSGTLKKNKDTEQMRPYPVKISPELESQIHDVLTSLDIKPIDVKEVLIILIILYKCVCVCVCTRARAYTERERERGSKYLIRFIIKNKMFKI